MAIEPLKKTALYCGMSQDIITPFILVPDFDILFAMDAQFCPYGWNNSWLGQQKEIVDVLKSGSNLISWNHYVLIMTKAENNGIFMKNCYTFEDFEKEAIKKDINIHDNVIHLVEPIIILDNNDDGNRWHLKFYYNGKERELIYYHNQDIRDEWPEDIKDVDYIMKMGTPFNINNGCLQDMVENRVQEHFTLVDYFYKRWPNPLKNKLTIGSKDYHYEIIDINRLKEINCDDE